MIYYYTKKAPSQGRSPMSVSIVYITRRPQLPPVASVLIKADMERSGGMGDESYLSL